VAAAAKWKVTPRTRSFAAADGVPVALHSLPGLQGAFPGIQGLNRLTAQVAEVTQFDETDWAFFPSRTHSSSSGKGLYLGVLFPRHLSDW
jgi:hypothetical protein